ncbi:hypothetical protein M407DRAFT_25576 [Tulasnella calospora MUT 4182]|uniref:CS domain-containing protein n=1 Tax=Tulasnella calospora MUT 4182 TaxID=1051891 RepID=A0A0C3QFT5_9AGAM|nr:hypothetical protein M407DRAFT_25576 [Tulasnella calospora MUT 4182]
MASSPFDGLQRWSWHQSHDQATVLLLVPGDLGEDDLSVFLDDKHLIVSVRGDAPAIKGRLYAPVKTQSSTWQLERDYERKKGRKSRTGSTSAASSGSSSYAFLTDPDISTSFANSVAAQTDTEDFYMTDTDHETSSQPSAAPATTASHRSPSFSPQPDSHDEETSSETHASEQERTSRIQRREKFAPSVAASSRPVSPPGHSSLASSAISTRPIQQLSRLLTIHLDKLRPEIWPSLIVAGVPPEIELESLPSSSEVSFSSTSTATLMSSNAEQKYNMDATSLVAVGLVTLHDDVEGAFEYFCRAWLQEHNPVAAMKLVSVYLPLQVTAQRSQLVSSERNYPLYLRRIGGNSALAKLYVEAGTLYLDGVGSSLAMSIPTLSQSPFSLGTSEMGATVHGPDPEAAQRYFRRARALDPSIEIPDVRSRTASDAPSLGHVDLVMPGVDLHHSSTTPKDEMLTESMQLAQKRRRKEKDAWLDDDNEWGGYLYLPGLLGAGLAIGIVGIMSVGWWRNNNR